MSDIPVAKSGRYVDMGLESGAFRVDISSVEFYQLTNGMSGKKVKVQELLMEFNLLVNGTFEMLLF